MNCPIDSLCWFLNRAALYELYIPCCSFYSINVYIKIVLPKGEEKLSELQKKEEKIRACISQDVNIWNRKLISFILPLVEFLEGEMGDGL